MKRCHRTAIPLRQTIVHCSWSRSTKKSGILHTSKRSQSTLPLVVNATLLGPREIYDSAHKKDRVLSVPFESIVDLPITRLHDLDAEDLLIISKIIRRAPKLLDSDQQASRRLLAQRCASEAARLGNEAAILFVAEETLRTPGTSPAAKHESLEMLNQLARHDNGKAHYLLANELYSLKKTSRALKAYRRAGELGVPEAYTKLGRILLQQGQRCEAEAAFKFGADGNEPNSQFMMSTLVTDPEIKLHYLQKAAGAGSIEAAHNLGERYRRDGQFELAQEYLTLAASAGFQPSQINLATLYSNEKKWTRAQYWYEQASRGGGELASHAQDALRKLTLQTDKSEPERTCCVM